MPQHRERLTASMTLFDMLTVLAEGNPGALQVALKLYQEGGQHDPASALGGLGSLLSLDTLGVYGSDIWLLYKDGCKESLADLVMFLRSSQLTITKREDVHDFLRAVKSCKEHPFDPRERAQMARDRLKAMRMSNPLLREEEGA